MNNLMYAVINQQRFHLVVNTMKQRTKGFTNAYVVIIIYSNQIQNLIRELVGQAFLNRIIVIQ